MPTIQKKELLKQQKQIAKKLWQLNDQQYKINEQLLALTIPVRAKQIGKCYIYRNGNGQEHWPVYARILGIVGNQFQIIEFEQTPASCYRGGVSIKFPFTDYFTRFDKGNGWKEITFEEFEDAYQKQINNILDDLENIIFEELRILQKNVTKEK